MVGVYTVRGGGSASTGNPGHFSVRFINANARCTVVCINYHGHAIKPDPFENCRKQPMHTHPAAPNRVEKARRGSVQLLCVAIMVTAGARVLKAFSRVAKAWMGRASVRHGVLTRAAAGGRNASYFCAVLSVLAYFREVA